MCMESLVVYFNFHKFENRLFKFILLHVYVTFSCSVAVLLY